MSYRIAIARLWHEGNSFSPVLTCFEDFRAREWRIGTQVPEFYRGTHTEIGAAVDFFDRNEALIPIYLRCAAAGPGGAVDEADLLQIVREIVDGVRQANADALYLSLHGATTVSPTLRADLELLLAVRRELGEMPLAVSLDLHANVDPQIAQL